MDLDKIIEEMINALKEKFQGCSVVTEYGGAMRRVIHIVWEGFNKMPEEDRQKKVWEFLASKFTYSELQFLIFIMTWTPEERETYSKETA